MLQLLCNVESNEMSVKNFSIVSPNKDLGLEGGFHNLNTCTHHGRRHALHASKYTHTHTHTHTHPNKPTHTHTHARGYARAILQNHTQVHLHDLAI